MTDEPPPKVLEDQETGEHYVVLDKRRRTPMLLGLTPWQLAVVGTLVVAVVLSAVVGAIGATALSNTHRLGKSICAQAVYLEGVKTSNPAGQERIDKLVRDLRSLQRCPKPRQPKVSAPPG